MADSITERDRTRKAGLRNLLSPDSIVVVGASDDLKKPGGKIVQNILDREYAGRLFLINPKATTIQGRPALAAIRDLPLVPDLALIAIPAALAATALMELVDRGVKNVIILSAGFGEVNEQGKKEEIRLARLADENGVLLLGPNCLGVMSPCHAGKFAGLLPRMKPGGIDFISGSGATVDYLAEQADKRGLAFHTFVTVGNSAQTGVTDILALYDQAHGPDSSKILMLYLEHPGNPRKLLESARSLASKGCVLTAIKSGVTEAGRRAAASHTGALAAADDAVQALFDKAGIIRVTSRLELVDLAAALVLSKGVYDGRRVAIVTDAGGPGVMLADELNRQGLSAPAFKPATQKLLAEVLPPGAGLGNPVDCLPSRNGSLISKVLEIVSREEADAVDYIICVFGDSGLADNRELYQAAARAMDELPLPVFPSFCTAVSSAAALENFKSLGKCYFEDEVSLARALGRMVNRPRPGIPETPPAGYDSRKVRELLKDFKGTVPPNLAGLVLDAAGIPRPLQAELRRPDDLESVAAALPFPWAMKIIGPLHKSDSGGVALGVKDLTEARAAWGRLMALAGAEGVLVQPVVSGTEVIMGVTRAGDFGSLVAFGLGGIFAEALGDVRFGLAPLSRVEARRLIEGVRGRSILDGMRGRAGLDLDVLTDLLVRTSWLAEDLPRLVEMDLNPVKGEGRSVWAVDARIIMDR
ncbi:MAG: acetate--CoA ligase family protein [Pseudomonadota bacterium]